MSDNIPTPRDGTEDEQEQVTPEQPETPADETPAEDTPQDEPETPTGDEPAEPETPAPATPQPPSVEERYRQSSSEAIILNAQNKRKDELLNKLTSADAPTDAEILAEYPDFNEMNATTQKVIRDIVTTNKRQRRIDRQLIEEQAERQWQADLKALMRKSEYASLKGDEKFEEFVFQPKHQGVDIQTLADAYLIRSGKAAAPAAPAAPPAPPASSGLPRGSGGPRGPQKPKKLTLEDAKVLRETNWKEYMKQVRAGNIEELE